MNADEYRKKIEQDILDVIAARLTTGEMTAQRAREIAQFVLDTLKPHMTLEQIQQLVLNFDQHFPELAKVAQSVINDQHEVMKKTIADHVHKLLQENKLDEAISVLKGNE